MTGAIAAAGATLTLPVVLIAAAFASAPSAAAPADVPLGHVYTTTAAQSAHTAGCAVPAPLLAAIGYVESRHAAGHHIDRDGNIHPAIIGPPLDGSAGMRAITDTDHGTWDGDQTWDRAIGPMQFLPASWRRFGRDGNGDGTTDPHNVFDATLAAAAHLCLAPPPPQGHAKNLHDRAQAERALYAYNRSPAYVSKVLSIAASYIGAAEGSVVDGRAGGWTWPARGPVTSEYGRRWGRQHEGIDIGLQTGAAIYAAGTGVVTFVGRRSGYGNLTLLDHGDGIVTAYAHQSHIGVKRGQHVAAGERIGSAGCTGTCTGPHLHFEVRINGSPRNPRSYLP